MTRSQRRRRRLLRYLALGMAGLASASAPGAAPAHTGMPRLTLAAAESTARAALAPLAVDAMHCFRPNRKSGRPPRNRALCLAAHPAPADQICRSLVDLKAPWRKPDAVRARLIRLNICIPDPVDR